MNKTHTLSTMYVETRRILDIVTPFGTCGGQVRRAVIADNYDNRLVLTYDRYVTDGLETLVAVTKHHTDEEAIAEALRKQLPESVDLTDLAHAIVAHVAVDR